MNGFFVPLGDLSLHHLYLSLTSHEHEHALLVLFELYVFDIAVLTHYYVFFLHQILEVSLEVLVVCHKPIVPLSGEILHLVRSLLDSSSIWQLTKLFE